MAIYYFGDHSVTFIKKSGNLITYKRSWVDWRLVPASRPFVSPAAPNVQIVAIPGSNRTIDLTESLSGSVTFGRRSGTWTFIVDHDKWPNWHTAYKEIMTFVNGQELYCVLEDDHDTVYHGRLALNEWSNGDNYSQITIGYNFEYDTTQNNFTYSPTKSVSEIDVSYNQNRRITTNSSLDDLREDLVVTATFDNGDAEEIEYYTLEGDLSTSGTKTITASCNNVTDTFTVEVAGVYDLKYYNYDGSQLLHTETVVHGEDGTYNGIPTRASDSQYIYTFVGWSTSMNATSAPPNATKNITSDRDVYAAYGKVPLHTLKYYNYDGSQLLHTETVVHGEDGTYNGTPTRASDSQYIYTFVGWATVMNLTSANANATKNIISDRNVYAAYSRQEIGEDIPVDDQGETPLGGG